MAGDKSILQLANRNPILTDTGVFADVSGTFGFQFMQLLSLIQANLISGAVITFGTTIPANTVGNNGDVYVKTTTGQFAQKISGAWTIVYTVPSGAVGNVIKYGITDPNGAVSGNAGDLFIDTDTATFYESSGGTVWVAQFSMATGPGGPRGNSVLNGTIDPVSGTGIDGDFYYNTATETIFGPKASGVWPSGVLLKGGNGNTVLNGTSNPINSQGANGDFYINTNTNVIFGPKAAGAWPGTGTSLIGNVPLPTNLDYPKGSPNPIVISNWQGAYANVYGNLATIAIEVLNNTGIGVLGSLVAGSGGTNGTYNNVLLTGGTGALATANITIAGGVATAVTLVNPGTGYTAGDVLSAAVGSIAGFSITVTALGKNYTVSGLQANKIMDSTGLLIQYLIIDDPDPANASLTADNLRVIIKQ